MDALIGPSKAATDARRPIRLAGRDDRAARRSLTAYQSARYARRYLKLVEQVKAAEAAPHAGAYRLAEAVARNLYKLMGL